jgi:hypothetical protein
MLSRIAGIGLVAVLALALVGGSAYILLRPTEAQAEQDSGGRSREAAETRLSGNGPGNGGEAGRGRGQGAGGGGESAKGPQSGGGDHHVETWLAVDGTVVALEGDELTVKTADGEMQVHLGPEWYWETQGVALDPGNEVEVSGFYEGEDFEVGYVENLTTGESATLRDDTSRPMWAGRGRWGR